MTLPSRPRDQVTRTFAHHQEQQMMDVIVLVIGLAFFVLSVGYCYACDRL
jgi:hypothetical protein